MDTRLTIQDLILKYGRTVGDILRHRDELLPNQVNKDVVSGAFNIDSEFEDGRDWSLVRIFPTGNTQWANKRRVGGIIASPKARE